jgi:XTP/dITP diphosphohydrolase
MGEQRNADDNMNKVLENLDINNRKAQFKTVIALNIKGKQHLLQELLLEK